VKDPQHDKAIAVQAVLKHIGCAENLQHNLAIFLATHDGPSEPRVFRQNLRFEIISAATRAASDGCS
jgi:hypothetical protein